MGLWTGKSNRNRAQARPNTAPSPLCRIGGWQADRMSTRWKDVLIGAFIGAVAFGLWTLFRDAVMGNSSGQYESQSMIGAALYHGGRMIPGVLIGGVAGSFWNRPKR
jgi:hypothetical protein